MSSVLTAQHGARDDVTDAGAVTPAAGTIKGDVRVSGHPKVQETFARIMGYVEQYDIHSPNVRPCAGTVASLRLH